MQHELLPTQCEFCQEQEATCILRKTSVPGVTTGIDPHFWYVCLACGREARRVARTTIPVDNHHNGLRGCGKCGGYDTQEVPCKWTGSSGATIWLLRCAKCGLLTPTGLGAIDDKLEEKIKKVIEKFVSEN